MGRWVNWAAELVLFYIPPGCVSSRTGSRTLGAWGIGTGGLRPFAAHTYDLLTTRPGAFEEDVLDAGVVEFGPRRQLRYFRDGRGWVERSGSRRGGLL